MEYFLNLNFMLIKTLFLTTIVNVGAQHLGSGSLLLGQQPQYYTPPTPPTTATLGQAYNIQPQPQAAPAIRVYQSPTVGTQYAPAASVGSSPYSASPVALAQAAPAAPITPSSYGWQVQHQSVLPQSRSQPQTLAPASVSAQQYATAPTPQQYTSVPSVPQQQYQQFTASPAPVAVVQMNPSQQTQLQSLHRPASVHYAQIGENLAGDYKFGYRTGDGNSFREESRLPDGTVQGQYGFVDADGKQRVIKYQAGIGGFQVLSGDGAAPVPTNAAPVARSAGPAVTAPEAILIPQWAQSHLNAAPPQPLQGAAPEQYAPATSQGPVAVRTPPAQYGSAATRTWGTHFG